MRRLSTEPACPRVRAPAPAYPILAGLGAMLAVAACGASPSPVAITPASVAQPEEAPAQVAVVSSVVEPEKPELAHDEPAPPPPPADLLAGMPLPKFAEDNLDTFIGIGCGGGCPPAYVLETEHRDARQVEARLKYCETQAKKHIPSLSGTVTVHANIGEDGKAKQVSVDASDSVPVLVTACVHTLVRTAVYSSKYHYPREAGGERRLGEKKPADNEK
jgi:hypothetical protein